MIRSTGIRAIVFAILISTSLFSCSSADSKVSALAEASEEFRDEVNKRRSWVQKELNRAKNELESSRTYLSQLEANFSAARSRVDSLETLVSTLDVQLLDSNQQLARLNQK